MSLSSGRTMTDEDWLGALDLATMWTFDDVGHFQYIAFIF